jgi:hypothetical protein
MLSLMKYLPVAIQTLGVLIGILYAFSLFVNAVQRMLPPVWIAYVEKHAPRVAWLARATRKIGGDVIPALQSVHKALAGHPYVLGEPMPSGAPMGQRASGVATRANDGFAKFPLLTLICASVFVAVPLSIVLHACSGTQLDREMRAADTLGISANHAEPVWINAYRQDGRAAADHACTNTADASCVAARLDALHAVTARWMRVRVQWELASTAHAALAGCLESARASDGGLCPDLDAKRAALVAALALYRCEVHAVGHPELDLVPDAQLQCGETDGGVQ